MTGGAGACVRGVCVYVCACHARAHRSWEVGTFVKLYLRRHLPGVKYACAGKSNHNGHTAAVRSSRCDPTLSPYSGAEGSASPGRRSLGGLPLGWYSTLSQGSQERGIYLPAMATAPGLQGSQKFSWKADEVLPRNTRQGRPLGLERRLSSQSPGVPGVFLVLQRQPAIGTHSAAALPCRA